MTEAVFDFAAINRRLNRKPEPVAAAAETTGHTSNFAILPARDLPEITPEYLGYVPPSVAMATLRAEVEQMERDQDILALRLKADEAMKHAREQAKTAVFDEFGSRDELMKLWGA